MRQQINLYDPALRHRREWLTLASVVSVAAVLLVVMAGWSAWARHEAERLAAEVAALALQLKAAQDQVQALGRDLAGRKPDPRLEQELAAARALFERRAEVLAALDKGLGPQAAGFAEYLRGLARQTPAGLWLTGFSVAQEGADLEIRGRTLDPALLPEYIRRLNAEQIFQGRAFAALQVRAGGETPRPAPGTPAAQTAPGAPPFHEFTLVPIKENPEEKRP